MAKYAREIGEVPAGHWVDVKMCGNDPGLQ
jgi:hypothetical protein